MLLSFIMPAYKRLYLEDAIRSIVNQTAGNWELVIVDDCSPEDLAGVVNGFRDPRIRYVRNDENIGGKDLVAQWNHSISFARGEWITLAADDDLYDPHFCEEVTSLAQSYPRVKLIRARTEQIDRNGNHLCDDGEFDRISSKETFLADWLTAKAFTCVGNYAFERNELLGIGGFVSFPCGFCSDIATPLLLSKYGVANTSGQLFKFRQSAIHLSGDHSRLKDKLEAMNRFYEWLPGLGFSAPGYDKAYVHAKYIYDCFNHSVKFASLAQLPEYLKMCRMASGWEKTVMVARWIKTHTEFFLKPFIENISFLLCLWLLASAGDTYFWSIHGNPVFGAYMGVHGFIQVYFIVLLWGFLKGKAASVVKWVLLALGYINVTADAMVHNIMHFSFTGDMVAIILGSNASEAAEFLPMYLTPGVAWFLVAVIALSILVLLFARRIVPLMKKWGAYCLMAFLIASIAVVTIRKSNNWEGVFLNKIGLFLSYDSPVDLVQYRTTPEVEVLGEQPDNIVVIIGEALSRNHCSLYGYDKRTQPCLEEMARDSLISVYDNVEAPFPNTSRSFKAMMSTYKESSAKEDWYSDETFLFDAMKGAGYNTYWISNQSSVGLYDNIVAKFAQLSDSTIWVGTKGLGIAKSDLDELVLPHVQAIKAMPGKKFIVVHLMGSHEDFRSRCPLNFAKFQLEDYRDRPENQRGTLCAYDNSILYNDYIVSSLMKMFIGDKNFVVYFPDHGMDIFDTDPAYAGHARPSDPSSCRAGVAIPFIASRPNSSNYPPEAPFNTEDLFEYLMDIAKSKVIR